MSGLFESCLLCGANGAVAGTLRVGLVKWLAPVEGTEYSQLPRCSDAQACRERIEARGERWEVDDSITHSTIPARPEPRKAAAPEPEPVEETAGWFA